MIWWWHHVIWRCLTMFMLIVATLFHPCLLCMVGHGRCRCIRSLYRLVLRCLQRRTTRNEITRAWANWVCVVTRFFWWKGDKKPSDFLSPHNPLVRFSLPHSFTRSNFNTFPWNFRIKVGAVLQQFLHAS